MKGGCITKSKMTAQGALWGLVIRLSAREVTQAEDTLPRAS